MFTGVYIPLQDVDYSNLLYVGKYKHVPSYCVSMCTDATHCMLILCYLVLVKIEECGSTLSFSSLSFSFYFSFNLLFIFLLLELWG